MFHSFDTHQIVKSFITNGFNEKQAEVIVKAIAESRDNDLSHLATKVDLANTKAELKSDIANLRTELKGDIANLRTELKDDIASVRTEIEKSKNEMLKWFIGISTTLGIASISTMVACFKLFIH